MFTLANSIAVSMYLIGFVEALLDMLEQYVNGFTSILHAGKLQVSFKQFQWKLLNVILLDRDKLIPLNN
jgi:hypothetical protein